MRLAVRRIGLVLVLGGGLAAPGPVAAQLDRYDYEYLSFRGIGLDAGYMWANKVDPTVTFGGRVDLGYAGPGLRIVPGLRYWSSTVKDAEVAQFESTLRRILEEANPGQPVPDVELGSIKWSDVVLSLDGHFVWEIPGGLLSYLGAGFAAHFLNGSGEVVNETFIEDLLDRVSAGFNAHAGLEAPLSRTLRLYGAGRFEILDDLNYFQLNAGLQFMFGGGADERAEGP
jgi:hypothetical protein